MGFFLGEAESSQDRPLRLLLRLAGPARHLAVPPLDLQHHRLLAGGNVLKDGRARERAEDVLPGLAVDGELTQAVLEAVFFIGSVVVLVCEDVSFARRMARSVGDAARVGDRRR